MIRLKAASPDLGLPFMLLSNATIITFASPVEGCAVTAPNHGQGQGLKQEGKVDVREEAPIYPHTDREQAQKANAEHIHDRLMAFR